MNFLAICLEFSITHRVGTERNGTIIFISLSQLFPTYFGLKWIHNGIFSFFEFFLIFFWKMVLRIGQERNGTIIFIFSLSQPLQTYFGLKWGSNGIFLIFLIFLLFCFGIFYYTSGRNVTERNGMIIFIFSFSQSFPTYFGLKWSRNCIFQFFEFFSYFYGIFYYASDRKETEW